MEEDEIVKSFGVRTFGYDKDGFMLNGRRYVLHGVCEHQDFAGMGVALNQDIVDFKVRMMKDMGVNAWRSAHHFASGDLLDVCDRLGIILIDENRLPEASPWRLDDFRRMLKRCVDECIRCILVAWKRGTDWKHCIWQTECPEVCGNR